MSTSWRIALVGAEEPVGTAFAEACEENDLLIAGLVPVALQETDQSITFRGEDLHCQDADAVDWGQVGAVVMATAGAQAKKLAAKLVAEGRVVLWPGPGVPGAQAVPEAASAAMLRSLHALNGHATVTALSGFLGLPMAARGEAAIEELANQTRGLFAMEPVEPEVFPVPISFNVIPHVADSAEDARAAMERDLQASLQQTLGSHVPVQFIAAWLPTFYGAVAVVHGQCKASLVAAELRAWLQQSPGVLVMDSPLPGGVPTPATDAQESADVFVGRIQVDAGDPTRFSLWLTFDYPRLQAAQMVSVLEKLIESASK